MKFKLITLFIILILSIIGTAAITYTNSYSINEFSSEFVDVHNDCKQVINSNAKPIFIPTKTKEEWESFQNNLPNQITLSDCFTYEWYQSGWTDWSSKCFSSTRTQTVYCKRSDGIQVADNFCSGTKPLSTESRYVSCVCRYDSNNFAYRGRYDPPTCYGQNRFVWNGNNYMFNYQPCETGASQSITYSGGKLCNSQSSPYNWETSICCPTSWT